MDLKIDLLHEGKNIEWGCQKGRCWGWYLVMQRRK